MTDRSLENRVVVVTGAGRGLGLAYALDLAARGASVVVNTRPKAKGQPASAEAVAQQIRDAGGKAVACALAVEAPDAGDRLLAAALEAFGRIDGLINNAGVPEAKSLHKQSVDQVRGVFEINFFGALTATLPIYRRMREQGSGRIVMTTSAAGLHGVHGMAAYSASKAAVIGLMRVIALEGASKNVHANAIAPYALTGMTEKYVDEATAAAMPAELVAPVVSWLVSEACALNGETLVAGAGKVRPAYRIEGPGLDFGADAAIALERFDDVRETLMSAAQWTRPADGNLAFEAFLAASPPKAALA
ncbi:MAG: SDR family NAD(P)-dependent oxidoreductase [Alphaproteobacteria bacterium]|nr:SDR family NAD(P)-dependent oxidoreductase [Alphaproteobacteria bacterium]MBU2378700.1 SDR family NAD(P)-dependent oxidoreductase [Alphaproteobacteria bacterium]